VMPSLIAAVLRLAWRLPSLTIQVAVRLGSKPELVGFWLAVVKLTVRSTA
jgi:hypothetical protein